jgi:hypothetical protein
MFRVSLNDIVFFGEGFGIFSIDFWATLTLIFINNAYVLKIQMKLDHIFKNVNNSSVTRATVILVHI